MTASLRAQRRQRVDSSSWKDGEADVHRRLTLERQVTSTFLPDCAIKPPAAEAETRTIGLRSLLFVKRRAPLKVASQQRSHPQVIWVSSCGL